MMAIDQDDALGVGNEEYSDTQSMFGNGRGTGRPTATVAVAEGGSKAKFFMIAFALLMLAALGWVGWKFIGSRGGGEVDGGALLLPAAEPTALPMTGAPVNEVTSVPTDGAQPVDPAKGVTPAPSPPQPVEQIVGNVPVGVASQAVPGAVAAGSSATQPVPGPAESPLPSQSSDTGAADQAAKDANTIASLREQLSTATARLAVLERDGSNHVSTTTPKTKAVAVRAVAAPKKTVASRPVEAAAVPAERKTSTRVPPPSGVILKAVLEGRAWLQVSSGDTISVAPGDDVAGVGTVSAIDAERAEVRFGNGAVLK